MKIEIIRKLDILIDLQSEDNIYQITLLKSIKKDLINEWNAINHFNSWYFSL